MSGEARIRLGVNVDHVATVRNARGGSHPDPVAAAKMAIAAGADGITAHLREDRRHIRDNDIIQLKAQLTKPLNFEMAATAEMLKIACEVRPHAACLVPERRQERTTEGGLDVVSKKIHLVPLVAQLKNAGIRVSLFIAAEPDQIRAAAEIGAPVIELHTGAWCEAVAERRPAIAAVELQRIKEGAILAQRLGLEVHAGHGLDYVTAETVATIPQIVEVNIGHFLVGEAISVGLEKAVRTMRASLDKGRALADVARGA